MNPFKSGAKLGKHGQRGGKFGTKTVFPYLYQIFRRFPLCTLSIEYQQHLTLRGICNPTHWSIRICNPKKQFLFAGHTTPRSLKVLADLRIRKSAAPVAPDCKSGAAFVCCGCAATLRGICNPTQWSIRICNPKKQFLFAGHTHTTVIESPCGLADSEIRSSCCTGLQIRRSVCLRNNPSVFHAAANRIDGYQKILTAEKEDILTWQSKISYLPI